MGRFEKGLQLTIPKFGSGHIVTYPITGFKSLTSYDWYSSGLIPKCNQPRVHLVKELGDLPYVIWFNLRPISKYLKYHTSIKKSFLISWSIDLIPMTTFLFPIFRFSRCLFHLFHLPERPRQPADDGKRPTNHPTAAQKFLDPRFHVHDTGVIIQRLEF